MKKLLLIILILIPAVCFSQRRKATDNIYGTSQEWEVKKFKANRIATGSALLAAGTVISAGCTIHSLNITNNNEKTLIYAAAGAAGAIAIVGSVLIGQGVKSLQKQLHVSGLKFTGNAIAFRF